MATYAIGDLQGCGDALNRLLEHIHFDSARDSLWFTGDLVNRGPDSLAVLRLVKSLGSRAVTVLGNHDLHLLALRYTTRSPKRGDTVQEVLRAEDCDELLTWLRYRPLLHIDPGTAFALIHAGLPCEWSLSEAAQHAREAELVLQSDGFVDFLAHMYGSEPDAWDPALTGKARLRFIVNCFTRMRYLTRHGRLDLKAKGPLGSTPASLIPWFMHPARPDLKQTVLFGHWSTLRLTPAQERQYRVIPLDTGAVWGGALSAYRLEDGARFSVPG